MKEFHIDTYTKINGVNEILQEIVCKYDDSKNIQDFFNVVLQNCNVGFLSPIILCEDDEALFTCYIIEGNSNIQNVIDAFKKHFDDDISILDYKNCLGLRIYFLESEVKILEPRLRLNIENKSSVTKLLHKPRKR